MRINSKLLLTVCIILLLGTGMGFAQLTKISADASGYSEPVWPQSPKAASITVWTWITNAEKLFASLAKELNLHHLSFWRKKFPANKESAYALRIRMIPEQKLLMESVKIVAEQNGNPLAVNLARNGALVVKEIIA